MSLLKRGVWIGLVLAAVLAGAGLLVCLARTHRPEETGPASGKLADAPRAAAEARPSAHRTSFDAAAIEERLRDAVRYLASDELQGRGAGTKGIDLAADYVAGQFHSIGLKNGWRDGTAFQQFYLSSRLALGSPTRAALAGPDGQEKSLRLAADFMPISLSASGALDARLAFVGYGITAPELGYDDYAGIDVGGKAVLVLRRQPRQADPNGPFSGPKHAEHGYLLRKIANAAAHGAAVVVFCTDAHSAAQRAAARKAPADTEAMEHDPLMSFDVAARLAKRQIPVLHVRRAVVAPLVASARGSPLAELERAIDQDLKPQSFDLPGWRIRGEVTLRRHGRPLKNVLGLLDGQGPLAEETIVVGAHYDHLGASNLGSAAPSRSVVYSGADDNASGTAVLIEVARDLAERRGPLKRRVLFVGFAGEELGLLGSERYVRDPPVPLAQTIAMVNLDMVGRLRNRALTVYGADTAREFGPLLGSRAGAHGLRLHTSAWELGLSDHEAFQSLGIPALHFFTGLHADYHTPGDDYQKLDYPGMRRIAGLAADLVVELADAPRRPRPVGFGLFAGTASSPGDGNGSGSSPGKAYMGVSEKPDDSQGSYLIAGVRRDGPAERAGLRPGDRILSLDGQPVANTRELQAALARCKPGQKAAIIARRDEVDLQTEVTLGARQ